MIRTKMSKKKLKKQKKKKKKKENHDLKKVNLAKIAPANKMQEIVSNGKQSNMTTGNVFENFDANSQREKDLKEKVTTKDPD